ncbi:putative aldouronate transport system permease protein [Actinopolymorpha singaporensis]|uniref:Putative aldouronate transport system permease protein n=1 Tax=Actinopolymorpha singaporensis TaxID=117157 RepID=A0A1H1UR47_9ACTN|nr:putative aldouronate transport system permease protein [Actinopolymorpha singaporensis]
MSTRVAERVAAPRPVRRSTAARIWQYRTIYLLILPTIVYFVVFAYLPMIGLQIAFKDFRVFGGMWNSPWVGLDNFRAVLSSEKFPQLVRNTLLISTYRIVFGFPVPLIFALLLNEVRTRWFKRSIQTVTYFPHFLSWVVFAGIVINILGPSGLLNTLLLDAGGHRVNFLTNPDTFRSVVVLTGIMKEFGWGAIIYLAALSGIDAQLYEAARVDGAGKLRQIWHVTLPGLRPVMAVLLVLSLGNLLDAGFDQIFQLYNGAVLDVGDIIDTYVYRIGLLDAQFETATAVGLFKGVVGMVMIVTANHVLRRMGQRSIW